MEVRFLCVLLAVAALQLVLPCAAQPDVEDDHLCLRSVPQTRRVTTKCRKSGKEICTRIVIARVNKLSCCEGWEYSNVENKCVADCKRGCKRGICTAPDTCSCPPPLILRYNISCEEPQCNPSCVNANCVDDDKCICNEGFTRHNATYCAPICPGGFVNDLLTFECKPNCDKCVNGNCTAPNTCTCDEGYTLENSTCVPYCKKTCENGKCIEPNKCACLPGYEQVSAWACKPKCDSCDNGECTAPHECNCFNGYFKADGKSCTPACSKTCSNGSCSAPDTCTCNKGYELDSEDKFKCKPTCKDSCVNGTCTSPDTCTCDAGFEKLNNSVCKPICTYCEHGVCISPDNCRCDDGFNRTDGTCRPVCSSPCVNGFCESPESCACQEGYLKNLSQSICYKPCVGECYNGECTVDGECLCNFEYKLFNDSCMMPDNCEKCGVVCSDDNCQCEDGRPCRSSTDFPAEAAPSTSLAGLQFTWLMAGGVSILLVTILIFTIGYIWKKRREYGVKITDKGSTYPSVLYTIPNTLIQNNYSDNRADSVYENDEEDSEEANSFHRPEDEADKSEKIPL